jgi:hypothetical protein
MGDISTADDKLPPTVSLITRTTVLGIFYTLVLLLYCLSVRLSYLQLRKESDREIKRRITFRLILASVMVICATIDITLSNILMRIIYVDYGTLPGGSLGLPAALHAITVARIRVFVNIIESLLISGVLVRFLYFLCYGLFLTCTGMACISCLEWDSHCQTNHSAALRSPRW